jgi:hypothetical protein
VSQLDEHHKRRTAACGYEHEVGASRHEFRHSRRGALLAPRRSGEKPECSSLS